jgi:hypothetical protein
MSDTKDRPPIVESLAEEKTKWTKHLETARAFYRTKLAIQRGIPLYEWSITDLQAFGYLGPWKFNAIETAITGGLASLTVNIANALSGAKPAEAETLDGIDPALATILKTTSSWLEPFTIPIFLTGFVYLMGWGTLRRRDSTSVKRLRARLAYLYFDGAYGLYSQLFLAFGVSAISTDFGQKVLSSDPLSYFAVAFFVALVGAGIWQLVITGRRIPRLLFVANGYSGRVRHFWQRSHPTDPPWNKLVVANILGGWPLLIVTSLLITAISFTFAWLLYLVRGLVA